MSLTRQQWPRAEALFCMALELPAARRGAYLLRACPDDSALREEVATLLAAAESANGFLSQPVAVVIRSDVDGAAARDRLRRALETVQGGKESDELYRALAHMLWARLRKFR